MIWHTMLLPDFERAVVTALQKTVINSQTFRPEREPNISSMAISLIFCFEHAIGGVSCVYRGVDNPQNPESCWCLEVMVSQCYN